MQVDENPFGRLLEVMKSVNEAIQRSAVIFRNRGESQKKDDGTKKKE